MQKKKVPMKKQQHKSCKSEYTMNVILKPLVAHLAGGVEYTDCISVER